MISDIIKKIFHIRKYENVIYEAKKKNATALNEMQNGSKLDEEDGKQNSS
jgi:hypothetical protein